MTKFYRMMADTNIEDYVKAGDDIKEIASFCRASFFQFLDHKPINIDIDDDCGLTFPDFLYDYGVPLVSPRFKQVFDKLGVDNLFYKQINLNYAPLGRHEPYILALPPRIRAVRQKYMRLLDEDGDESEGKELIRDEHGVAHYKINSSSVGNYHIFKLADVWDTDIIVTEDLMAAASAAALSNVYFEELEED